MELIGHLISAVLQCSNFQVTPSTYSGDDKIDTQEDDLGFPNLTLYTAIDL